MQVPSISRASVILGVFTTLVLAGLALVWIWNRPERDLEAARLHLEGGQFDEALARLRLPENRESTRDRALILRARVALESRNFRDAVDPLDRVDSSGPWSSEAAFWKGRILFEVGQYRKAVDWFATASKGRTDDVEVLRWLSAAAYELGDRDVAATTLERVVKLDARDSRAWRTLGLLYKERAEPERARLAYEKSLRLEPSQPTVRLELAEVLLESGDPAQAEKQLERCRGLVSEVLRLNLLASAQQSLGKIDRLEQTLKDALASYPDDPGLLAKQARLDLAGQNVETALARLEKAVAIDPYSPDRQFLYAQVLRMAGRLPDADMVQARAGAINRKLEEMDRLNAEAAAHPDDPEVRSRLGTICLDLGKRDLAVSWFRAAVACDPHHEPAREALGSLGEGIPASPTP